MNFNSDPNLIRGGFGGCKKMLEATLHKRRRLFIWVALSGRENLHPRISIRKALHTAHIPFEVQCYELSPCKTRASQ